MKPRWSAPTTWLRVPTEHAFASTRAGTVGSRVPRGTRDARRRPMVEAMAAARVRPTRALRGNGGPASTRPAPRRADPRVPGFQSVRLPPASALPRPQSRPPRSSPGRATENLESWQPGESANARQDPRFPDSPARRLPLAPGDRRCGLRLADAVIALASRPWSKHPLLTATARAVTRA